MAGNTFYGCDLGPVDGASSTEAMVALFQHLRPQASARPLIRIGDDADGAYLLPDDLEGVAACFSPGVNNFKTFEDAMVERYGMNCHMCDFTSDVEKFRTPLIEGKQTFIKKWLDRSGPDAVRLEDWIADREPEGDLLLQIDIEGAEYRNLLALPDEALARFRIIVIELHGLWQMRRRPVLEGVMAPFFGKLARLFVNVHAHPNNCCGTFFIPETGIEIPNVLELTYVRRDRVDEGRYPPQLPHPLDVGLNVKRNPPVFLGGPWLDGERSEASERRIAEVDAAFAAHQARVRRKVTSDTAAMLARAEASGGVAPSNLVEVAEGRPFSLSSRKPSKATSVVVEAAPRYFFFTREGQGQFVMIDLGASMTVGRIVLTNRRDGDYDKARSLFAIVSDAPDPADGGVVAIPDDADFLAGQSPSVSVDVPGLSGRYVFIRSSEQTTLHLANIEVFAAA